MIVARNFSEEEPTYDFLMLLSAITCGVPTLTNGQINPSGSESYYVNTTISFSCNYGYRLDRSDSSTCSIYGIWDPQPATCTQGKGMYKLDFLHLTLCGMSL